jgi:hypothetical protein
VLGKCFLKAAVIIFFLKNFSGGKKVIKRIWFVGMCSSIVSNAILSSFLEIKRIFLFKAGSLLGIIKKGGQIMCLPFCGIKLIISLNRIDQGS